MLALAIIPLLITKADAHAPTVGRPVGSGFDWMMIILLVGGITGFVLLVLWKNRRKKGLEC